MTENYVGALVEVEIDLGYTVKLRVEGQTDKLLSSNTKHAVWYKGRKVTVIEPAPIPDQLNGEVWRSPKSPQYTYTWDEVCAVWRGSHDNWFTQTHPSAAGYVKIAEGVA